ncbi:MAG: hypothetical protein RL547_1531 [Actinomycetota bacterium]
MFVGKVVVVGVEGSRWHAEIGREFVQFVETRVAHEVAPTAVTEPPVRSVDVQSQRRRSGRTRTGTGLGRVMIRTPAPIPTAVATMVTIQDATITTYSPPERRAGRTASSERTRNRCRILRPHAGPERACRRSMRRPMRTPTADEPRPDVRRDRSPVRWRPTWCDAPRTWRHRSCTGTRTTAWTQCRHLVD